MILLGEYYYYGKPYDTLHDTLSDITMRMVATLAITTTASASTATTTTTTSTFATTAEI